MVTTGTPQRPPRTEEPGPSPLEFTSRIRGLGQLLETRMQAVCTDFGLTRGEFDVLCALGVNAQAVDAQGVDAQAVTPKQLLTRVSVSPAGLSNRLYRLELKGLVRRTTARDDRRSLPVMLTAVGWSRFNAARLACEEAERELLATVGHDVGDRIHDAMTQLGDADVEIPVPVPRRGHTSGSSASSPRTSSRAQRRATGPRLRAAAGRSRSAPPDNPSRLMPWPQTGPELEELQSQLAGAVENVTPWVWDGKPDQRNVCAIFVSYGGSPSQPGRGTLVCAAAVAMCGSDMVASSTGARWLAFSYRPSYLGLVVGPLMDDIVQALGVQPSVCFVNGTGRDHARGAGVAIQLGAAFDMPTIGITNRPILAVGPEPPSVVGRLGTAAGRWASRRLSSANGHGRTTCHPACRLGYEPGGGP